MRDLHLLEGEIPLKDGVLNLLDPADLSKDVRLDKSGTEILTYADGRRTVEEIVLVSGLDREEVIKTICALSDVGIVNVREKDGTSRSMKWERVGEGMPDEKIRGIDAGVENEIGEMHERYKSLGFYGVLGVENNASFREIKTAYHKAAKKYHPDLYHHSANDILKDMLGDIFSFVCEAYATLSDPERRRKYDKTAIVSAAQSPSNAVRAKELFEEGRVLLSRNKLQDAEQLFGKAVYLDGATAKYHYYYGLALERVDKLRDAEKSISRALELDANNAEYLAELGFVYLGMGFPKRAAAFFAKALKISPGHPRASEGMRKTGQ